MTQHRIVPQKLPLAGVLNAPVENRDSAYYSGTDSKHTSTASGMGVLSPPGSGFQPSPTDKTPSPTSNSELLPRPRVSPPSPTSNSNPSNSNLLPRPLVSPINSNMSVASMVSPTTPGSGIPRGYELLERPQSIDSAPHSATYGEMPEAISRRESVDSRMNQGFNDMRLNNSHNNSPYATHNHSTTSIHNTLQQQRRPPLDSPAGHRISNGYQPSAERNIPDINPKTRVAPVITGPTTSHIARGAEPVKGQAWAFPEEEIRHVPSSLSFVDSRRSSIADSVASSQYTTESRLPPGQRRLDDGMVPNPYPGQRLSSASGDYPGTIHHHSLQHRQLGDLRDEEGFPGGSQPYSRTPELRVSHKLAERKRRTEMKELFEQLRDLMPQERGSKASKWEILTKAIAEHQRQGDMLRQAQMHLSQKQNEVDSMSREIMTLRAQLNQHHRGGPGPGANQYDTDPYRSAELPPLRNTLPSPTGPPPPEAMSGVQYEPRQMNGFRPSEPGRF